MKVCPFRQSQGQVRHVAEDCLGKECAWWSSDDAVGRCAVSEILRLVRINALDIGESAQMPAPASEGDEPE